MQTAPGGAKCLVLFFKKKKTDWNLPSNNTATTKSKYSKFTTKIRTSEKPITSQLMNKAGQSWSSHPIEKEKHHFVLQRKDSAHRVNKSNWNRSTTMRSFDHGSGTNKQLQWCRHVYFNIKTTLHVCLWGSRPYTTAKKKKEKKKNILHCLSEFFEHIHVTSLRYGGLEVQNTSTNQKREQF